MEIGHRIKQLRLQNDLTLEELASRTELTKGFLSQLERGLTMPSIPTLEDIAEALGVTMSEFFKEETPLQIVFTREDAFVDEKEDMTIHWIIPNAQKNAMEPMIIELEPGKSSMKVGPHEGEEFGYVLSGKVDLVQGSKKGLSIKKGESFYLDGREEHYLMNTSTSSARVLWVSTPPEF